MNVFQKIGRWFTDNSRQINPGAVVPIIARCSEPSHVMAQFRHDPEQITLREDWHQVAEEVLHEAVHYFEQRLTRAGNVDGARTVRHAFRDLCGPTFEIGHDDLMTELP